MQKAAYLFPGINKLPFAISFNLHSYYWRAILSHRKDNRKTVDLLHKYVKIRAISYIDFYIRFLRINNWKRGKITDHE